MRSISFALRSPADDGGPQAKNPQFFTSGTGVRALTWRHASSDLSFPIVALHESSFVSKPQLASDGLTKLDRNEEYAFRNTK